jgi:hypothetical protein
MQKELVIKLNDDIYNGLMKLVGEKNASQFIESVLRPIVSETTEEFEVKIPLNKGERKIYLRSPHLKNSAFFDKLRLESDEDKANV